MNLESKGLLKYKPYDPYKGCGKEFKEISGEGECRRERVLKLFRKKKCSKL